MSRLAHYIVRKCLVASWTIALVFASFFAFCIPAPGQEPKDKAELAERAEFIRKAMDEELERLSKQIAEMSKGGRHPYIIVATLRPFGDWDFYFVVGGDIVWKPNPGQKIEEVVVPEGFVTDLASIPRVFWQMLRPEGRYAYAAVVHDYLYWTQMRPREEADRIFRIAMEDSKVDPATIEALYQSVRRLGQAAWDNNTRLRESGERRILKRFPNDFTISWSHWKQQPDVFD